MGSLSDGWLVRAFDAIDRDIDNWPRWIRATFDELVDQSKRENESVQWVSGQRIEQEAPHERRDVLSASR